MFDPETASLLRSAPQVPNLETDDIPGLLTRQYARLVSARLRGAESYQRRPWKDRWSLEALADTYEIIASITDDVSYRKSAAFVSATAQQILAKEVKDTKIGESLSRDHIDPTLTSALLFLMSEQYADAFEAAKGIREGESSVSKRLSILIKRLAAGNLSRIYNDTSLTPIAIPEGINLEQQATFSLFDALGVSIEMLAAEILAKPYRSRQFENVESSSDLIELVGSLSKGRRVLESKSPKHIGIYAGPRHLASLLKSVAEGITQSALTNVRPPSGSDNSFWSKWIEYRAEKFPFVWPNHREAIAKGFVETGKSAVMVLPTGAGKTTISSLKIAGVLARGKKVVFLAPTHALVEQLTTDLQEMFPESLLDSVVSSDFDQLLLSESSLKDIEVMTPERCLAMLSYAPEAFADAGLLVFDECHLLDGSQGKVRRALDAMFCVLTFSHLIPDADLLFMSAMLKNGEEFSDWVSDLTQRECVHVELIWKPSRQARGVVCFETGRVERIKLKAKAKQRKLDKDQGRKATGLRADAQRLLTAGPYAIWGLQHNWLQRAQKTARVTRTALLERKTQLSGSLKAGSIALTPNANHLAAEVAKSASKSKLKTIIFVNNKLHAVSTAKKINRDFKKSTFRSSSTQKKYWDALEAELGDLKHSYLTDQSAAVPHHANMFPLERRLSEAMFRSKQGADIIVATPTIAQGLNLPADLVIIAGDKRSVPSENGRNRTSLAAHELLNAAGRAGRAGHVANGVVLLIHDQIIEFDKDESSINSKLLQSLQSILPEDDRCISITDPLTDILDKISDGQAYDADVQYTLNRIPQSLGEGDGQVGTFKLNFSRSFGAFMAKKNSQLSEYREQVKAFDALIGKVETDDVPVDVLSIAAQSALPTFVVSSLVYRLKKHTNPVPKNLSEWLKWTFDWLKTDKNSYAELFSEVIEDINKISSGKKDTKPLPQALESILPSLKLWIDGRPISEIEISLGGCLDKGAGVSCPLSRILVNTIIPRALTYTLNLISQTIETFGMYEDFEDLDEDLVASMGTLVRRGYDSHMLYLFGEANKSIISRVQLHKAFEKEMSI